MKVEKIPEKRAPRSYKAKQTPYVKASKRARKEGTTLAELIEIWVTNYSFGHAVGITDPFAAQLKKQ